jgi:hypothetical protein
LEKSHGFTLSLSFEQKNQTELQKENLNYLTHTKAALCRKFPPLFHREHHKKANHFVDMDKMQ